MYVCMYVCIYIYIYVCLYAWIVYIYYKKFTNWARFKNMLGCCHPGLFFRVHSAGPKEKKLSFSDRKDSINPYL